MINLYRSLQIFSDFLRFLILARIIMSIFRVNPNNPIGAFIYQVTEPLLGLARGIIEKIGVNTGMFDFSPILAIFILELMLSAVRAILF